MPTENRRVAAYLPKAIEERLEQFKTERGLKGDSPALIAILEEYFGVSRDVAHLSSSEIEHLSQRIEVIEQRLGQLKNDVFDELPGELNKLLFFWKTEVKNELLSELKSELPEPEADRPKQPLVPSDQEVAQESLPESKLPSESDEQVTSNESESSSEPSSKPLDGSVAWMGIELSRRLKMVASQVSALKDPEKLALKSREKDPDGLAWQRIGKGQYVPILNDRQGS